MKNILFFALLSTVALGNAQSSYAVKTRSDGDGKSSSSASTALPVPDFKSMNRRPARVWMPSAPMKNGSVQQRYWAEKVRRDGGRTIKMVDGQLWIRSR